MLRTSQGISDACYRQHGPGIVTAAQSKCYRESKHHSQDNPESDWGQIRVPWDLLTHLWGSSMARTNMCQVVPEKGQTGAEFKLKTSFWGS